MSKLKITLTALLATCAVSLVSAETVARALVTAPADGVGLFNVDENDAWTFDKWLVPCKSASFPNGPTRPVRALYQNGIVYVADSMAEKASETSTSYVRKYTLQGEYLGDLCEYTGCIDGMVLSRDGKYLFASQFSSGNKGRLSRYEIATDTWTHYLTTYMCIQQLAINDAGRLFVACRYTDNWEGGFEVYDIETMTSVKSWRRQKLANCWGCGWNPSDENIYVCYTSKNWGVFDVDGEIVVPSTEANVDIGWCYGVGFVNGKMYYASKNSNIYRMDNVDLGTHSATFTSVYTGSNWKGDKNAYDVCELAVLDATEQWSFEESAGSAKCAESVKGVGVVCGEGGFTPGATGGVGGCAAFTSAKSRAILAGSETLLPAQGDFTVTFWAYLPAGDTVRHLFSNATGTAGDLAVLAKADNTLGLSFTPVGATDAVTITTEETVADSAWHQVGLVRRGTSLELYLDGVSVGSAAIAADNSIAQDRLWHCGSNALATDGFVGAGAFLDELSFFNSSLLKGEMATLYRTASPTGSPAAPTLPTEAAGLDATWGNEIAHAFSFEAPLSSPGFLIGGDGAWYAWADRANERYAADQTTRIWKSADRGTTWTELAALPGSGVSLFAYGTTIGAIGLKADGTGQTLATWSLVGGQWTVTASVTSQEGTFVGSTMPAFVKDGTVYKAFSCRRTSGQLWPATVSASTDGTGLAVKVRGDAAFIRANAQTGGGTTLADVPGGTVTEWTDHAQLVSVFPFVDRKSAGAGQQTGVERACYHLIRTTDKAFREHYLDMFRGGAKPFAIQYDATSKLYWTVTAPVIDSKRLLTESAETIVDRLAVYSSPDLAAWTPCGEIFASNAVGFIPGAFAVDGNDLIVAYAVAADDNAGGVRQSTAGTYLAWKRIADFRTAFAPVELNAKKYMLLCDGEPAYNDYDYYAPKTIRRYYATEDGEWQPGGIFATGDTKVNVGGTDYTLYYPATPVVRGKSIYVLSGESSPVRIFEFGWKGNLKRMILDPDKNALSARAMDLSPDGQSAVIVTIPSSVVRMNLASGKLTTLVSDATNLDGAYRVAVAADGSFYVSNYKWGKAWCRHYDKSGNFLEQTATVQNYAATVDYDMERGKVYAGDIYGSIKTVDAASPATWTWFTQRNVPVVGTAYHSALIGNTLHVGARYGYLSCYDIETGTETAPFATLHSVTGVAYFEKQDLGFSLYIR